MPRARNIKHSFFMDDQLAEHDPYARLFFQALWCLADYNGNIEWREKKIKALTLPYDDVDIKQLAINLDKSRFITFYSCQGKIYLNIRKFTAHQHPHPNEKKAGSEIPEYSEEGRQVIDLTTLTINHDLSRLNHDEDVTNQADSLLLIPDPLLKEKNKQKERRFVKPTAEEIQAYCDERQNGLSGEQIFDHYEANGWRRGKTPIKDWKACVRTWEKPNEKNRQKHNDGISQTKLSASEQGTKASEQWLKEQSQH